MAVLFKPTKALENAIDQYLDKISEGALVFVEGIKNYVHKDNEKFQEHMQALSKLEGKADELRRHIENDLYEHSLIPEHRGDVLGLLETIDDVINSAKSNLFQFDVEKPFIP
jgi:predicted phosphate transport protein (TIGR00153 family)